MNKFKSLLMILMLPTLLLCAVPSASAFNLFGNGACFTTNKNGQQVPIVDANGNPPPTCKQATDQTKNKNNPVLDTINTAANIIALVTGIGAVVMIIIGGLTMVISGGSTEAVAAARRRIIFSVVGLAVVALAWTITRFITDRLIQ